MIIDHKDNSESLLSLMQIVSSVFPTGGFGYSKGLELAVESGWVNSIENFLDWQKQWIYGQLIDLDWPMLKRCYNCVQINDAKKFKECAVYILSCRDTSELRLEEQCKGKAISRVILQWYTPINDYWISAFEFSGLASLSWLGCIWNIPIKDLALGYAYNILETAVMVGLKLIPFGQQTAQKLLKYLLGLLPDAWIQADLVTDNELGNSFLLQSIASSCHETQYSRLFRS